LSSWLRHHGASLSESYQSLTTICINLSDGTGSFVTLTLLTEVMFSVAAVVAALTVVVMHGIVCLNVQYLVTHQS